MRTKGSGWSGNNPPPANGQSPKPCQGSLVAARRALLMKKTSDSRSPWIYDRVNRSNGVLRYSEQPQVLERPYPDQASLRTLSRKDQRARVGDSDRPLDPSKPTRLWKSQVRLLAEQRLAEDEAEELVLELNMAMEDGDLEQISLLTKQLDELANGICKKKTEKAAKDQTDKLKQARTHTSVLGFVRMLRSVEEED